MFYRQPVAARRPIALVASAAQGNPHDLVIEPPENQTVSADIWHQANVPPNLADSIESANSAKLSESGCRPERPVLVEMLKCNGIGACS
jgi:hypothetical protein